MEKINYGGWPNCIRMSNDSIELIATTDVGPRIIRFGFIGKDNEFWEDTAQLGKSGANEWVGYGGHRFWIAPEAKPKTYHPDNEPINHKIVGKTLKLIPPVESTTGIQKEVDITLDPKGSHAKVVHKITNYNPFTIELAPWPLTVMNSGGKLIFPNEPYFPHPDMLEYPGQKVLPKHFLPVRSISLWPYTKLSDPRWKFTDKYIILRQDSTIVKPQKIGITNEQNWGAYGRKGHLFVKKVIFKQGATYPDNGCVFETYTNSQFLELESLGPLEKLASGASLEHQEDWYLFDGVDFEETDESIDANILPKVKLALG